MSVGLPVSRIPTLNSPGADLIMKDGGITNPHSSHILSHQKAWPGSVVSFVINNIHGVHPSRASFHVSGVWASCATAHLGLV